MKKILAGGALTAVALGGMFAMAPSASAHTPKVHADCDSGLVVNLTLYRGADVDVVIDGETVASETFKSQFVETYDLGDDTVEHTWSVTVDAHDSDKYDWSDEGSIPACAEPTDELIEPEPTEEPSVPAEEPTPEPTEEPSTPAEAEPTPEPSDAAPVEEEETELAATGATVGGAAIFALLLVGGGAALVITRKRLAKN